MQQVHNTCAMQHLSGQSPYLARTKRARVSSSTDYRNSAPLLTCETEWLTFLANEQLLCVAQTRCPKVFLTKAIGLLISTVPGRSAVHTGSPWSVSSPKGPVSVYPHPAAFSPTIGHPNPAGSASRRRKSSDKIVLLSAEDVGEIGFLILTAQLSVFERRRCLLQLITVALKVAPSTFCAYAEDRSWKRKKKFHPQSKTSTDTQSPYRKCRTDITVFFSFLFFFFFF